MKKRQHLFRIGMGFAIFLVIVLIFVQTKKKNAVFLRLPFFQDIDINGRIIDSSKFRGKTTFISFVNPASKNDRNIFQAISNQFGNEIRLVAISASWKKTEDWEQAGNLILISDSDRRLLHLFGSSFGGFNFVYDQSGNLLGRGSNQMGYEEGPKATLTQHLRGVKFDRKMILPGIGEKIATSDWLKQLEIIRGADVIARYFVFGLFSSICDACSSGRTIQMLKRLRSAVDDRLAVYIVLSPDFDETDLPRLRTQLQLNFPCVLSDQVLAQKWSSLKQLFRPSDINEFVLLVDSSGRTLLIFDRNGENPHDSFYYHAVAIIANKGKKSEK